MLEAIRRHFRDYGAAPTHRLLSFATGIGKNEVGRVLRQLAAQELIMLQIGVRCGITLHDRTEMLSDAELELATRARGWTVTKPADAIAPLADVYHVDPGTKCRLFEADLLAQIDAAEEDQRDGHSAGNSGGR